jgi:simple sugar transport system permease protein
VAAPAQAAIRRRGPGAGAVAALGIVLGCVAFLLALPPITARAPVWPVVAGVVAVAAGIWAVTRGVRRPGWSARAAGRRP